MKRIGRRTFASLRKHRNYRLYFFGQVVSVTGTWMQHLALAWFVIELTRSPLAVGFLAFCRFVPFTVFGLVAGVLADRFDNRRLFAATQLGSMTVSIALAGLAFSGAAELWLVYLLAALGGTAAVLDGPGRHALTSQLVAREEVPNAIALNVSLFNVSRLLGPAVAGAVIATAGVAWCFAINAVSFLAVFVALALMRREELFPIGRAEEPPTMVRGVREALRYAAHAPGIRAVILLTASLSAVGINFHVIVPLLAADDPSVGASAFGLLASAFGAGALLGALLSATIARASWTIIVASTVGFSAGLLALGLDHRPAAAAVFLFVVGACFTLESSNSQSILQLTTPDHLRGRVLSLYIVSFGGLAPVGGLVAGWLAEVGGLSLAFGLAGAVGLVSAALILASRTPVRHDRPMGLHERTRRARQSPTSTPPAPEAAEGGLELAGTIGNAAMQRVAGSPDHQQSTAAAGLAPTIARARDEDDLSEPESHSPMQEGGGPEPETDAEEPQGEGDDLLEPEYFSRSQQSS